MFFLNFLPLMIILVGAYILIKLNFFYILHPIRTLKFTFSGQNSKKSIVSLMLALAGTLGVGNIVGVAFGIYTGGAGSVFWLCISALFSSAIKYAEVSLSSEHKGGLGIIGVIKSGGLFSNELSKAYAFLALILSFTMGSLLQAEAIAMSAESFSSLRAIPTLILIFIFTALLCLLGKEKIKASVSAVIPLATLAYGFMCLFVIFSEWERIPEVFLNILRSAFNVSALSGGIGGFLLSSGMKEGFARGLLSNEAGAGTSSFSHTSHNVDNELTLNSDNTYDDSYRIRAGVYGILEVIFDTLLLCPLTALAILLGTNDGTFSGTTEEISRVFKNYMGSFAPTLLLLSITAFAVSTVLCWYYYGRVSYSYITKNRFMPLFSLLFIISFAIGLAFKIPDLIFINDTVLFFMTLITLYTVIKNRKKIKAPKIK